MSDVWLRGLCVRGAQTGFGKRREQKLLVCSKDEGISKVAGAK